MRLSKAQTKVIGIIAAVLVAGAITGMVIHRIYTGERSKMVVVQPAAPQSDETGINLPLRYQVDRNPAAQVTGPRGMVVTSDGKPVPMAEILLATAQDFVQIYGPARSGGRSVRSDKEGRFSFPVTDEWTDLVVRHTQGFAHVRAGQMPKDGRIVIQAWARVEGTLRSGTKPLTDEQVSLRSDRTNAVPATSSSNPSGMPLGPSHVLCSQTVRTDENGRFVFARAAPGVTMLARLVPRTFQSGVQISHIHYAKVFEALPGQTVQVEVGGVGRPVVGKAVLDDSSETLNLFGCVRSMAMENRHPITYPVSISPDGSLRADEIPAGAYQLDVSCETMDPGGGAIETLAQGSVSFTIPEISGGRSDEPFDAGTLAVQVRPHVKIGAPAPALEARKPDGSTLKLSDYPGKHVLLRFTANSETSQDRSTRGSTIGLVYPSMKIIQDRIGSSDQMAILSIILEEQAWTGGQVLGSSSAGTVAVVEKWREKLDPAYVNSPTTYLIDPEGKVLARVSPYSSSLYGAIDRALGQMRWNRDGVQVRMEIVPETQASAAFPFKTIPTISMEDAGQSAVFSIVDGKKANFASGLNILNDGMGPRNSRDESLMCTFAPNTLEGRIKADLGKVVEVGQINSYAWYKDSHRCAVYRVYGSDGSEAGFNPEPKIGSDPATCGWSLVAAVDTRSTPGGTDLKDAVGGQSGVSIHGEKEPIGKYRYLLFVTFATETQNVWGQTFWSEIDVIGK